MPNDDFPDPYCTCVFVSSTKLFINLFHGHSQTHYHFIWDTETSKIIGVEGSEQPVKKQLECLNSNFPYKSFFSEDNNEIYCFYRDGIAFSMKLDQLENYRQEQITQREIG
jgi:hypothetical protein